jgi:signal transduction histidine kinase/CheY-like chemotaxis protein
VLIQCTPEVKKSQAKDESRPAYNPEDLRGIEALRHASVCVLLLRRRDRKVLTQNPASQRAFGDLMGSGQDRFLSLFDDASARERFDRAFVGADTAGFSEIVLLHAFRDKGGDESQARPLGPSKRLSTPRRELRSFRLQCTSVTDPVSGEKSISLSASDVTEVERARTLTEQFMLNMSHELRTPISGVIGCLTMLGDEMATLTMDQQCALDMANQSASQMLQVINDILDFTRAANGKIELESAPFDVSNWAESALYCVSSDKRVRSGELALQWTYDEAEFPGQRGSRGRHAVGADLPRWLLGDAFRLRQILLNLVGNSLKFTEGGHIRVATNMFRVTPVGAESGRGRTDNGGNGSKEQESKQSESKQSESKQSESKQSESKQSEPQPESESESESESGSALLERTRRAATHAVVERVLDHAEVDDETYFLLTVEDTGIGISPPSLETIWKPFEQADASTTRRYGGSGLGLAIIKELVELMGGAVAVKSIQAVGTVFAVAVPVSESAEPVQAPDAAAAAAPALRSLRVLLAEDNPVNQRVQVHLLSRLGATVQVVDNGLEAVKVFDAEASVPYDPSFAGVAPDAPRFADPEFDLVLMDISMPVMNGLDAVKSIRAIEAFRSSKPAYIAALTAHGMQQHEDMCLDAGMNERLVKPVSKLQFSKLLASR